MSADDLQVASPIGALTLRAAGNALIAIDFGATPRTESSAPPQPVLPAAAEQLAAYFAGELRQFDLPLQPVGTPFQSAVWKALQCVPYGETVTYGELARRLGKPGAARAVGRANARNPQPIVVPCHRVIGADGTLTGYAGGLAVKHALLDLEAASSHV